MQCLLHSATSPNEALGPADIFLHHRREAFSASSNPYAFGTAGSCNSFYEKSAMIFGQSNANVMQCHLPNRKKSLLPLPSGYSSTPSIKRYHIFDKSAYRTCMTPCRNASPASGGRHADDAFRVRVSASDSASPEPSKQREDSNPIQAFANQVQAIWTRVVVIPLSNFGFGKRSIWEGGVGLFILTGIFMMAFTLNWIKGVRVQARSTKYQAVVEFEQACGIMVGTPVRIRGADVGSVVGVKPSLDKIDAVVEIMDSSVVIPRNSLIEVNQSGLISETLIDITPKPPIPVVRVGPLDERCAEEGVIVCDRERIQGSQGVSLDELVAICTKIAKQVDQEGVHTLYEAVDKFVAVAEQAKPLLEKINVIAKDVSPLLADLSQGELLRNLEKLTKVASEAAQDLRELNNSILTKENIGLLRQSVSTLTKTLKNIESISSGVSGITGDSTTLYNLKQIIASLSRLVED